MEFELGSQAPNVLLLGESEREVPLAEICGEAPAALFFLRHFG